MLIVKNLFSQYLSLQTGTSACCVHACVGGHRHAHDTHTTNTSVQYICNCEARAITGHHICCQFLQTLHTELKFWLLLDDFMVFTYRIVQNFGEFVAIHQSFIPPNNPSNFYKNVIISVKILCEHVLLWRCLS